MNATSQATTHRLAQPCSHACGGQCNGCTTTHTTPPYPWDDITAIEDEIENDLCTAALQLLVSYACIAVVSFALGLFIGQL